MPYEDAFTPDTMLDGYQDTATGVLPPPEPAPAQDFDPRRDISPMAGKLFDEIGSARHLKPEAKFALQAKLLSGISDVSAQRAKLENERRQSLMDNMRIQEMQGSLASLRQRQQTAVEQTAARATFTDTVKAVMQRADLDPVQKSIELDKLATDNLGLVASDPTIRNTVDAARSLIPLPRVSTLTDAQVMDAAQAGVPPDVVARGNPYEIGALKALAEAKRKEQSDKAEDRKAAQKAQAAVMLDLAKDGFNFIPKDERVNFKIADNDPNEYLRPEDHDRGRVLARLVLGAEGYKQFDTLSDVEKRDALQEIRFKAMEMATRKALEETASDEDVRASKLVP